jgi:NADH:ubiquinone oxidoreductase subunit K
MNAVSPYLFPLYGVFVILMVVTGLYCVLATRNLIRVLIGLEILTKAITLLIIVAGHVTGRLALAQALAITLIVIEVVVISVAAGIVLSVFRRFKTLDVAILRNMKG